MKGFVETANAIFKKAVEDYHLLDNVDAIVRNPYNIGTIEFDLYNKNWIDTVQWHLEDIIRNPKIKPQDALDMKRRIDRSNQDRTDLVERIDTYFYDEFSKVKPSKDAKINTESPAWAVDRLSILHVKLFHMRAEVKRTDASEEHLAKCNAKLKILEEQYADLSMALQQLLDDYKSGTRVMKVYRQMKMYNDPELNPVLYNKQK